MSLPLFYQSVVDGTVCRAAVSVCRVQWWCSGSVEDTSEHDQHPVSVAHTIEQRSSLSDTLCERGLERKELLLPTAGLSIHWLTGGRTQRPTSPCVAGLLMQSMCVLNHKNKHYTNTLFHKEGENTTLVRENVYVFMYVLQAAGSW